ncbi:MarR family transcriptional regulator [Vibrio sp. SCSIO 43137]|uniref:MarR family transcriptional regulator n=1 Tax=Vibrio sp. SCSIO 43137 TaxID=3021011 RepID=UPI00230754DA|nr:MarR family transcriptional regulator [Vibrio sp. SCSIO 43137]WCE28404.1 MarR family transcriptional regulator [Vibrio sp. SCSIO 43137]
MSELPRLNSTAVLKLTKQLNAFREIVHSEVHPVTMMVLCDVINQPALSVSANYVHEKYNVSKAAGSRHCRLLTDRKSPKEEGFGLCHWELDPENHRFKYLALTEKGIEVARKLQEVFNK